MGKGTSESTQQSTQKSQTNPWEPTVPILKDIIGGIGGQVGNYAPNANETDALGMLRQNAGNLSSYAPQAKSLADDLLKGGPDLSGRVNQGFDEYKKNLSPITSGGMIGPDGNPQLKGYLDVVSNDVSNRINSMFAGAGRDFSGAHVNNLARGLTEGTAPILASQYNTDVGNFMNANNSVYQAGNTTTGLLSDLAQQGFSNRATGLDVGMNANSLADLPAERMLDIEGRARNLPLSNLGMLSSLVGPLAQLGGQSTGKASATGTQTMSDAQQAWGWMNAGSNVFGKLFPGGM